MAVKGKRFRFLAGPRNDMVRGWGGVGAPAGVDIVGAPPARPFEGLPPQQIYDRVSGPSAPGEPQGYAPTGRGPGPTLGWIPDRGVGNGGLGWGGIG